MPPLRSLFSPQSRVKSTKDGAWINSGAIEELRHWEVVLTEMRRTCSPPVGLRSFPVGHQGGIMLHRLHLSVCMMDYL